MKINKSMCHKYIISENSCQCSKKGINIYNLLEVLVDVN